MFKFILNRLPWRGPQVAAAMEATGKVAAQRAAEYVADRARYYAPVDTGRLRASIEVISTQSGTRWSVVARVNYARWVEFGHMAGGGTFVAPNPFMRRAFADGRKMFPTILKEAYVTALRGQSLGGTFTAKAA
jgi:hypothetical protein